MVASPSRWTTNHPWNGRGYVTWYVLNFGCPIHISGIAEARAFNFFTKGDHIKPSQRDDNWPLKGAWFCSRDPRVCVCVCVCLSVTLRLCIKMAKHRITQITPHDSPLTLVFWHQSSLRNSKGITPYGGDKWRWGLLKFVTFDEKRAITRKRYTIDIQFLLKSNRKTYVLYQMAMFLMTLGDL